MAADVDLLVGDAERSSAVSELRQHYEAGRLTLEEFEGRLEQVHGARTESDLRRAFRQLPSAGLPSLRPRDMRWRSLALHAALAPRCRLLRCRESGRVAAQRSVRLVGRGCLHSLG